MRSRFYIVVGKFGNQRELFSSMISYLYHREESVIFIEKLTPSTLTYIHQSRWSNPVILLNTDIRNIPSRIISMACCVYNLNEKLPIAMRIRFYIFKKIYRKRIEEVYGKDDKKWNGMK